MSKHGYGMPFTKIEFEEIPEEAIYEQAWVWDIAKQVLGAIAVLFVIFGVLKPAMKNLAIAPPITRVIGGNGDELDADQLSLSGDEKRKRLAKASYEENLQLAQSLATQEPKRVVQVVKNWMNE